MEYMWIGGALVSPIRETRGWHVSTKVSDKRSIHYCTFSQIKPHGEAQAAFTE